MEIIEYGGVRATPDLRTIVTPRGSKTIIIGDSIDATPQSWYTYYYVGSKRIHNILNAAISGNTTTMMLGRIDRDVLSYKPDVVILGSNTNDFQLGLTEALSKSNIVQMVAKIQAVGATPVFRTTHPADVVGAGIWNNVTTRRQGIQRYNAWLKHFAASNGIPVLDVYKPTVDPATGGFIAGYAPDGIHPTDAANKITATWLLTQPIPSVWKDEFVFPRAVAEGGNLIINGTFNNDTNNDGLADNWIKFSGATTNTLSAGDGTGVGRWQRMATAGTAEGAMYQAITTGFSVGDTIEFVGRVRTSGASAAAVKISPIPASASTTISPISGTKSIIDGVWSARLVVPAGTTSINIAISNSEAAGWMEITDFAAWNLTVLGIV